MHVGLLHSRIREDERLLLASLEERGHDITRIDTRDLQLDIDSPPDALAAVDLVIDRSIPTSHGLYTAQFLERFDIPVVNPPAVAATCADKIATSLALANAGVPTPRTTVAFDIDSALDAIETIGYPCVLKPVVGSWGRLMAKIDSRTAAEAILEHKATLGHYEHGVFYLQEFVEKPGRDFRIIAADGEPIAAMARESAHWLTNAAAGATVTALSLDDQLIDLAQRATDAIGGGLLGIDLMETSEGYTVHEVNHVVEFRAMNSAVEVDVAAKIVAWLEAKVEQTAVTSP